MATLPQVKTAREVPLLFSAPMIRAFQRRLKLQTRRLVKPAPVFEQVYAWKGKTIYDGEARRWFWRDQCWDVREEMLVSLPAFAPIRAGDVVWARETWRTVGGIPLSQCTGPEDIRYAASVGEAEWAISTWRPSIFMPKWAARFRLPVASVRAELLLDISTEDAMAEGIPQTAAEAQELGLFDLSRDPGHEWDNRTSRENYLRLWDTINPKHPAASNPAVWRIEFQILNKI